MEVWDEYRKLETLGHMGHVRLYSPSEVAKFLEQMGFRVEVIIHRGKWPSPPTKWLRTVDNVLLGWHLGCERTSPLSQRKSPRQASNTCAILFLVSVR